MRGDDEKQSTVADLCDKTPGVLRAVHRPSEEDLKAKIEVNIKPRKQYTHSTDLFMRLLVTTCLALYRTRTKK